MLDDPDYYDFYTDYLAADQYQGDYYNYDVTIGSNDYNFFNYYYGEQNAIEELYYEAP